MSVNDTGVFNSNGIELILTEDALAAWLVKCGREGRIMNGWPLSDGGMILPSAIFSRWLAGAGNLVIYDRFMNDRALAALEELFRSMRAIYGNAPEISVECFTTAPQGERWLNFARRVEERLRRLVSHSSIVSVKEIVRPAQFLRPLHDRFIQIDQNYTFLMTAGLDCFFAGDPPRLANRSCVVIQFDVSKECERKEYRVRSGPGIEAKAIRA
jgi:hypothetical protein